MLTPSLWFAGGAIFSEVDRSPLVPARIYLDIVVQEGPGTWAAPAGCAISS